MATGAGDGVGGAGGTASGMGGGSGVGVATGSGGWVGGGDDAGVLHAATTIHRARPRMAPRYAERGCYGAVMRYLLSVAVVVLACGKDVGSQKPAGTHADPVEVCERVADVCRLDKSKLGICVSRSTTELACASQH